VFPLVACNLRHFLIDNAACICKNPNAEWGIFLDKRQQRGVFLEIFTKFLM
jgi:hypothetical protein